MLKTTLFSPQNIAILAISGKCHNKLSLHLHFLQYYIVVTPRDSIQQIINNYGYIFSWDLRKFLKTYILRKLDPFQLL